jgi:hypothetical protein
MIDFKSVVLPSYAKWVALALLTLAVWGHGYVNGIERTNDRLVMQDVKIITKQGKTTEKIVKVYVERKTKQAKVDKEIKNEGTSYAIKYPDDGYRFNNEYVWLHDSAIKGTLSPLPSGELGDSSGVTVPETLSVSIHNLTVARQWKERALTCEAWTKEQEQLNG